jgi:hypothetical protein
MNRGGRQVLTNVFMCFEDEEMHQQLKYLPSVSSQDLYVLSIRALVLLYVLMFVILLYMAKSDFLF